MSSTSRPVAIVTDGTCDIPLEIADALRIRLVPAPSTLEGKTYRDEPKISPSDFCRRMPSPLAFEAACDSALGSAGQRIVPIHEFHRLSGIFNAATQAARSFGQRVQAIDGERVWMALGFQAIRAAEAALEGAALAAALRVADASRRQARLVARINTLEFLRRSGRVTWLRAGIGDLLRVKLLVSVVDGWVKRTDMTRTGTQALEWLISIARSWGGIERPALLHASAPDEARSFARGLSTWRNGRW